MPATLFFSYSHVDETLRNQLEVQLAALKRQGLLSTWHDRRIIAGDHIKHQIDVNMEAAEVILLLISPDFIASDYCYEREMARAMEKHGNGQTKVIPVILRPCDWHDLPFGQLLATPRDGKPITTWTNSDEAFLEVARSIKAAVKEIDAKTKVARPLPASIETATRALGTPKVLATTSVKPKWLEAASEASAGPRSSNLRVKKEFSELDADRFRQEGFELIARFFENSMRELVKRHPELNLDQRFRRVDATRFTAAVYKNGRKVCKGSASSAGGAFGSDSIEYVMDDAPRHGGMNEAVSVASDDQSLHFKALGMQSFGNREKEKLTAQGAAELFWELFIQPLQ